MGRDIVENRTREPAVPGEGLCKPVGRTDGSIPRD